MVQPTRMSAADTGILVIDVQDKLLAKIPDAAAIVRNIAFLLDVAKLLDMPAWATEQYPQGLGPTVGSLSERLPERADKTRFSCCEVPAILQALQRAGHRKVMLAGIETHVCVQLTGLDMLANGYHVVVAADAVGSRYAIDHEYGLRRLEAAGAILTTTESAIFEWVGGSDCPQFKAISKLVQERMRALGPGQ